MTEKKVLPGSKPLANARREKFCRLYVEGPDAGNATKCYESAGYKPSTPESCASAASELLRFLDVKQRVTWLTQLMWKEMDMTREEVVARTAAIARFDPAKLYDETGAMLDTHKLDPVTRMGLDGIEVTMFIPSDGTATVATKKYKGAGKIPALRLLMQQKRMIGADISVNINGSLADRLAAARKRARERSKE